MIKLSGGSSISSFQWSNDEQIYPFEKTKEGKTIYCKLLELNAGGTSFYCYTNIIDFDTLVRGWGYIWKADQGFISLPIVFIGSYSNYNTMVRIFTDGTVVSFQSDSSYWSGQPIKYYLLYTKI